MYTDCPLTLIITNSLGKDRHQGGETQLKKKSLQTLTALDIKRTMHFIVKFMPCVSHVWEI